MISTKIFDGYSCAFRQWKAMDSHCRFVHGYGVSFKVFFEGELDARNWVYDFGGMKRAVNRIDGMEPLDYFKWLLDHTLLVAMDDPYINHFKNLEAQGLVQLRVLPSVGCERFAQHLLLKINHFLYLETRNRVIAKAVEFRENEKNSAVAEWGRDVKA